MDGFDLRVNFWDLSGQPEFFEIRNEFYKDTQGVSGSTLSTDWGMVHMIDPWVCDRPSSYSMLRHGSLLKTLNYGLLRLPSMGRVMFQSSSAVTR